MAIHGPFGRGGGGGGTILGFIDREFDDRAARDAFYATQANRNGLERGETAILILDDGSGNAVVEVWTGADSPTTYDSTLWADITSAIPSAAVVKTLYESNANTNALTDAKLSVLNILSLINGNTQLQSTLPIVTTPTSIIFGDGGAEIASSGTVVVFEGTDDSEAFLLHNQFTPTGGSVTLSRSRLIARNEYTIQANKSENSILNPVFNYTLSAVGPSQTPPLAAESRRHTDQVTIESPDSGTLTATFRDSGPTGRLLRIQSVAITADTETVVDLIKPICTDIGSTINVTITGDVRLKGDIISGQFVPFLKVRSYLGYDDQIATAFTMNDFNTVIRDALQTLVDEGRLDASAIKNLPADVDNYVDSLTLAVSSDGTITLTAGRTGALADLTSNIRLIAGANVTLTPDIANRTITIAASGGPTPPQADHTNYIDVTTDSNASSVDTVNGVSSDDLNPTVVLETFTGNAYIQILQSQAHTAFTSIIISGINQLGGFTVNENARTIGGQAYRQYVTTNLITDALSGAQIIMGGAT